MELEEMESLWGAMSLKIENQKKLTDSLIVKMIQINYRNKINKILIPEAMGALVCFAGVVAILTGLQQLNTWYLLACGIISAFILVILPLASIKAVRKIRSINVSANNFKESLSAYSKSKIQLAFVQKLSFYLGAVLMLVIFPVMGKLISGTDLFKVTRLWYWYAIGFPFFYYYANWVFKSYRKTVSDAEYILKELDVS
jgi:hypothetical protein